MEVWHEGMTTGLAAASSGQQLRYRTEVTASRLVAGVTIFCCDVLEHGVVEHRSASNFFSFAFSSSSAFSRLAMDAPVREASCSKNSNVPPLLVISRYRNNSASVEARPQAFQRVCWSKEDCT